MGFLLLQIIFFCRGLDIRVAEVVKAYIWCVDLRHDSFEAVVHGPIGQPVPDLIGKHQRGIDPTGPNGQSLGRLLLLVQPQQLHD